MALLEATDIAIRFGGVQALDGIDLVADEYEIVGVLGPNGAGKTTFFNCLSGFARPDRGRVLIRGEDVTDMRPDERVARGLGRTFQQVGLVRSFTVLENLLAAQHLGTRYTDIAGMLGLPMARKREQMMRENAMRVLEFMDLAHLADERLPGLPYGTLKRVEVAASIAVDPQILILDEPLAGMAPEEAAKFGELLIRMRRDLGLTIVIVDHHVPQVLRVSDYVYVLNFGKLLARGTPDEIRNDPAVAEAYMGKGAA